MTTPNDHCRYYLRATPGETTVAPSAGRSALDRAGTASYIASRFAAVDAQAALAVASEAIVLAQELLGQQGRALALRDHPTRVVGTGRPEWDASDGSGTDSQVYTREGEWEHSNIRMDIERASNTFNRLVPSDSATVHQFIESLRRRFG
ncbi:hypothetical protein [Plantactinospora endophytica]|uniref:Uncharacterized protein n=1 Tax=Plantactinospora endophytica TaxID=673535 RepID=A0ABQ4E5Y8_9ACTN|nr:hypothetical protein [Plantactinospora endophytica]GIG90110.1 hypothetical protein Pen02_50460 [Plantactinospora endophytica]